MLQRSAPFCLIFHDVSSLAPIFSSWYDNLDSCTSGRFGLLLLFMGRHLILLNLLTIAIDGPAGAGKSTVAKLVAEKLGLLYVDTGAMYRAITLKALSTGVSLKDADSLVKLANQTHIELRDRTEGYEILLDGKLVTGEIRTPEVTAGVSEVSAVPGVRLRLVELQRAMADDRGVVMDGRDIGTYVLPRATLKIFLTASVEERARRRSEDLNQRGYTVNQQEIQADIERRDNYDSTREFAPLAVATDAVVVETTGLTVHQVVDRIVAMTRPHVL
ncbi:MAG: cytidylate kinase [Bacilli bacterium]|nr:cytidylate kinase [Bacilli bacterium]